VILGVVAIISAAFAASPRTVADDGMCVPSVDDTAGWRLMKLQAISVRVPPAFDQAYRNQEQLTFVSGSKQVSIHRGEGPEEITTNGVISLISSCNTMIGGRPVTMKVMHFTRYDPPQMPSADAGPRYVALARWGAGDGLPTVTAWIVSNDRMVLRQLKGIFYTADVGVKPPAPCIPQSPLPAPDVIVDSAAIAMRQRENPDSWPAGVTVLMLRFQSSGALGGISVLSGDLPDATKRALAMIVGTNARDRAPGDSGSVQLRVHSSPAGFSYEVVESLNCRMAR
jgi:hypothetical protein